MGAEDTKRCLTFDPRSAHRPWRAQKACHASSCRTSRRTWVMTGPPLCSSRRDSPRCGVVYLAGRAHHALPLAPGCPGSGCRGRTRGSALEGLEPATASGSRPPGTLLHWSKTDDRGRPSGGIDRGMGGLPSGGSRLSKETGSCIAMRTGRNSATTRH